MQDSIVAKEPSRAEALSDIHPVHAEAQRWQKLAGRGSSSGNDRNEVLSIYYRLVCAVWQPEPQFAV